MAYRETVLTANDEEHLRALRLLLEAAFDKPIRVIDEVWVKNELEVAPLGWGQKRTLRKLGYIAEDRTVYGSFSAYKMPRLAATCGVSGVDCFSNDKMKE